MTTTAHERPLLPTASGKRIRVVLGELLRARRKLAVGSFTTLFAATAVGMLTAPLLGRIVDHVAAGDPAVALTPAVVGLAVVAATQGAATGYGISLIARLGESMLAQLRERFIERALNLPLEQVENAGSGDLTARVTNDVSVIAKSVREALPELARSLLTIVLTFTGLAILDWRFLLAALLAVPIQLYTVSWYIRRALPIYAEQRIAVGGQQQQLLDTIGGARTVRAFGLHEEHTGRVRYRSTEALRLSLRGVRLMTRFFGRLNLAEFVGLTAILVTGFLLVNAGAATIGTATAAALYFHSLFNPINAALGLADDAQSATASLARLVGVTDLPATPSSQRPAAPLDSSIKATDVSHSYVAGHDVLREVDLHVEPSEQVALVGASGAGKTTIAKLIAGVHRPTTGSLSLGGVSLDELDPAAIRATVALISQEVHVFAGRLAEDLRLAHPQATDEELLTALDTVGALEWVRALPQGLETVVGNGGHRLTPMQAQQLALVRLVLAEPPIAILDEATAEAGSSGARELETAAARALEGRTSLVVAHRLTQAAKADRIIVLDDGCIIETGTHAELVASGGRYATLWQAWSENRQ